MTALAIDVGGTKLTVALVENNLQICEWHELPTPVSKTPRALRAVLQTLVTPLQGRVSRAATAPTGIIREGALLALNSYNLGGLMHSPLTQTLEQITDLPTLVVSDAQAVAWAEHHALGGKYRDLVFITVSTGMGRGVVSGGKLLTRVGGLAGHLGYTLADSHGSMCGYERVDCIEAITSGRGIAVATEDTSAGCDAKAIFSCTGQGNEQTSRLIHRSVRTLARLVAGVKAATGCQIMVIGGSVGPAEGYLALVEHYLAQEPLAYHVELLAVHHHHGVGLLGATLLAQGEQ